MKITLEQAKQTHNQSLYWRNKCGEIFMKTGVQYDSRHIYRNIRTGKAVIITENEKPLWDFKSLEQGDKIIIEIEGEKK